MITEYILTMENVNSMDRQKWSTSSFFIVAQILLPWNIHKKSLTYSSSILHFSIDNASAQKKKQKKPKNLVGSSCNHFYAMLF